MIRFSGTGLNKKNPLNSVKQEEEYSDYISVLTPLLWLSAGSQH